MTHSKSELRKRFKEIRSALPKEERVSFEQSIYNHVINSEVWNNSNEIIMYHSFGSEVSTIALFKNALMQKKNVFLPVIVADGIMNIIKIDEATSYSLNSFGIPEPTGESYTIADEGKAMLCIVPMLAFDTGGMRLGYGGGYYDRFLSKNPKMITCGLAFGCQYYEGNFESEPHDKSLEMIITETGIKSFR